MKIKNHKIFVIIFCIVTISYFVYGQMALQIEPMKNPAKDIDTHLANREIIIKYCMDTLSNPIDANSEDGEKMMAAYELQKKALLTLGELRAVEAAPLLTKMILYNIPGSESSNPTFVDKMFGNDS